MATFCTKDPFCDFKATPLQGAIKFGHTEVIALLLEQPNINVNVQSVYNYTALNLACMAGKTEVVRQLLQAPSIDPNIPNDFGRSPLMEAYVNNHRNSVKALLELDQVTLPKTANGKPLEMWFCKMCIAARHKRERERDMARQLEASLAKNPKDDDKQHVKDKGQPGEDEGQLEEDMIEPSQQKTKCLIDQDEREGQNKCNCM